MFFSMFQLIVLCLVAVAAAAPPAQILRYENENIGVGGYRYGFEQSDGTRHDSRGEVRNVGREDEFLAVTGEYSWIAPNGVKYIVKYVADDNGYQPEIEEGPGGPPPAVIASLLG